MSKKKQLLERTPLRFDLIESETWRICESVLSIGCDRYIDEAIRVREQQLEEQLESARRRGRLYHMPPTYYQLPAVERRKLKQRLIKKRSKRKAKEKRDRDRKLRSSGGNSRYLEPAPFRVGSVGSSNKGKGKGLSLVTASSSSSSVSTSLKCDSPRVKSHLKALMMRAKDELAPIDRIDLCELDLMALPLDSLGGDVLARARTLDATCNVIRRVPEALGGVAQQLAELLLSCNLLTSLPDVLCEQLKALRVLDVSYNRLDALPDGIGRIGGGALRELYATANRLDALPDSLAQLASLEVLALGENRFAQWPAPLRGTRALRSLSLARCRLEGALPLDALTALTALEELDLRYNRIESVPSPLDAMRSLQRLAIDANGLERFPVELATLPSLRLLTASSNRFGSDASPSMAAFTRLEHLDVSRNGLRALPDGVGGMLSLRSLDASYNAIAALPLGLSSLRALELVNLSSNAFDAFPDGRALAACVQLALNDNWIGEFPSAERTFEALSANLRRLNIGENAINALPSCMCADLTALTRLRLSGNNVQRLPAEFARMQRLVGLLAADNALVELPDDIGTMMRLEMLAVHGNRLSDVPNSIVELPSLVTFVCSQNPLSGVPLDVVGAENILDYVKARVGRGEHPVAPLAETAVDADKKEAHRKQRQQEAAEQYRSAAASSSSPPPSSSPIAIAGSVHAIGDDDDDVDDDDDDDDADSFAQFLSTNKKLQVKSSKQKAKKKKPSSKRKAMASSPSKWRNKS
jgi:Leucine-rich repeat (LRR) protein